MGVRERRLSGLPVYLIMFSVKKEQHVLFDLTLIWLMETTGSKCFFFRKDSITLIWFLFILTMTSKQLINIYVNPQTSTGFGTKEFTQPPSEGVDKIITQKEQTASNPLSELSVLQGRRKRELTKGTDTNRKENNPKIKACYFTREKRNLHVSHRLQRFGLWFPIYGRVRLDMKLSESVHA